MKIKLIREIGTLQISANGGTRDTDFDYRDLFEVLQRRISLGERFGVLVAHTGDQPMLRVHRFALVNFLRTLEEETEQVVQGVAFVSPTHEIDLTGSPKDIWLPPFPFQSFRSRYDALRWLEALREADEDEPE